MERDVIVYIRSCDLCGAGKSPKKMPAGKMAVAPPPSRPWEEVGVDFVGPLPLAGERFSYVCCVTDLFTGFVIAWPAIDSKAKTFAEDFVVSVVAQGYTPTAIRHDRGRTFENALVKRLLRILHIANLASSGYHPQFNGAVERTNGQFAQAMRTLPASAATDWHLSLSMIVASINSSVDSVRGETPFFLNHGFDFRTPISVAAGSAITLPKRDLSSYRLDLLTSMQEIYDITQQRLRENRAAVAERFNEHRRDETYEVGELVWLYTPLAAEKGVLNPKYRPAWKGPFRITRRVGSVNYELTNVDTGELVQSAPHVKRLKPYYEREVRPSVTPTLPEDDQFKWEEQPFRARLDRIAPKEPRMQIVQEAPEGSTIPEELETALAEAKIPEKSRLVVLFKALHKIYVKHRTAGKLKRLLVPTWSAKKTKTTRHRALEALGESSMIFATTERRTSWSNAVRDCLNGAQLEKFLRSVLLHFTAAFKEEIDYEDYCRRQTERSYRVPKVAQEDADMEDADDPQDDLEF